MPDANMRNAALGDWAGVAADIRRPVADNVYAFRESAAPHTLLSNLVAVVREPR